MLFFPFLFISFLFFSFWMFVSARHLTCGTWTQQFLPSSSCPPFSSSSYCFRLFILCPAHLHCVRNKSTWSLLNQLQHGLCGPAAPFRPWPLQCPGARGCNLLLYNKKENEVFHYLLTADTDSLSLPRSLTHSQISRDSRWKRRERERDRQSIFRVLQ